MAASCRLCCGSCWRLELAVETSWCCVLRFTTSRSAQTVHAADAGLNLASYNFINGVTDTP